MISWDFKKGNEEMKAEFSKLNGSEPIFDEHKWNNKNSIKKTHKIYKDY